MSRPRAAPPYRDAAKLLCVGKVRGGGGKVSFTNINSFGETIIFVVKK